jgi:hypothetical protein
MAIFSGKRYFNDILWAQTYIEKLNTKIYWYEKYQYIEKKLSCWNKCSAFRNYIETV